MQQRIGDKDVRHDGIDEVRKWKLPRWAKTERLEISIDDPIVVEVFGQSATTSHRQTFEGWGTAYKHGHYASRDEKTLRWRREDERWRIIAESTVTLEEWR